MKPEEQETNEVREKAESNIDRQTGPKKKGS